MISFIMMAYNVEAYISDALVELQKEYDINWELIIIDDFSTDGTFEVAKKFSKKDFRIKLVKNKTKGKVTGTNYGYSLTKGDIIKCIDSDDVLLNGFFKEFSRLKNYDAHCHSAYITDEELNNKSVYNINPLMISQSYEYVLSNLTSFPKWSWSFKRKIAEKIFPMPENLPFEDVWIALLIKKHTNNILVLDTPLYKYRQHSTQTFGGIINYNPDKVIFRANRLMKLMDILNNEPRVMIGYNINIFDKTREYNTLIATKNLSIFKILFSNLSYIQKIKITLIKKFPNLAKYITVLKWKLDAINKD